MPAAVTDSLSCAVGYLKNLSVLKVDRNHLLRVPDSIGKSVIILYLLFTIFVVIFLYFLAVACFVLANQIYTVFAVRKKNCCSFV